MENNFFSFNYDLINEASNEIVHVGTVNLALTDKEVDEVSQAIRNNGGHAVELLDIGWLSEKVGELAIDDYQLNYADDDFEWDDIRVEVDSSLPQELVDAATAMEDNVVLDCHFYYFAEGKEKMGTVLLGVTRDVFQMMTNVARLARSTGTDFGNLREIYPEAFAHSGKWVLEYAYKWGKEHYDYNIHAYLKEFPYQVYENIEI